MGCTCCSWWTHLQPPTLWSSSPSASWWGYLTFTVSIAHDRPPHHVLSNRAESWWRFLFYAAQLASSCPVHLSTRWRQPSQTPDRSESYVKCGESTNQHCSDQCDTCSLCFCCQKVSIVPLKVSHIRHSECLHSKCWMSSIIPLFTALCRYDVERLSWPVELYQAGASQTEPARAAQFKRCCEHQARSRSSIATVH